jgi:hydrogenase/urease accessory protein HupE
MNLTAWRQMPVALVAALGLAGPALAHPAPFSFVDIRLQPSTVEIAVVAHVFDLAYELDIEPPDRLFQPGVLAPHLDRVAALLRDRLLVSADGRPLAIGAWSAPELLPDRQSVRFRVRAALDAPPGIIEVSARLFPYDSNHQTFLNVYEGDALNAQAILGAEQTRHEYFVGTREGVWAVVRKFVPAGVRHILIGPDHLLFLIGLLLLGGSVRTLLLVVTGFTLAHSITLSLAVLGVVTPPGRLVEPLIALSIVYVGVDNLLARDGRDLRVWIAAVFGLIHGFGFASVLREMGLPSGSIGWSLFSFNLGVELGQLAVVVVVAAALTALQAKSEVASRRVAVAGSIVVIIAGAFWFIERVFFPGGMV